MGQFVLLAIRTVIMLNPLRRIHSDTSYPVGSNLFRFNSKLADLDIGPQCREVPPVSPLTGQLSEHVTNHLI